MKYSSTRGAVKGIGFKEAVMMGLAEDGGLLVPDEFPQVHDRLQEWKSLPFQQLCLEIMEFFVGQDLNRDALEGLINRSFASFRHPLITPVKKLKTYSVLELFHGPTFAFKDVALQFLGNLFEHFLTEDGQTLNVLGATSGDTGSAAIHGLRGKKGVKVFMLHPRGRVSPIQERQMTTVLDPNIHNLAVEGSFDDAQSIVKSLFNDPQLKRSRRLGAVNSINWARIMAQIVYYFHAWAQISRDHSEEVSFVVPTGNFGNVLAAHYARKMGLPTAKLVVASNKNDILHRFFSTGCYETNAVETTWSPSMDIQISSNFERYLFELNGSDSEKLRKMMEAFSSSGKMRVDNTVLEKAQKDFCSASVENTETLETIREIWNRENYLVDPHTAVGIRAAEKNGLKAPFVCLACAHPAKFGEAIQNALGEPPQLPEELMQLESLPTRCEILEACSETVKQHIETVLDGS
ncbi:MAG: threonine synthase [Deltaproteobacteria bacterium]